MREDEKKATSHDGEDEAKPAELSSAAAPPTITATTTDSETKKMLSKDESLLQRDEWSSKLDFILSCVGYAIGKRLESHHNRPPNLPRILFS